MKNFQAKLVFIIAIIFALIMLITPTTQAGYQSIRTGNPVDESATTWIKTIRQMEGESQGMGLNETIDTSSTSTLVATTDPNNIDVHLLKNTEYGATILLGASDYGKQGSSIADRRMDKGSTSIGTSVQASTTGNVSGVYELGYGAIKRGDFEWVAAGGETFINTNINKNYINRYTTNRDSAKIGDAMIQWHEETNFTWFGWLQSSNLGIGRGNNGTFAYYSSSGTSSGSNRIHNATTASSNGLARPAIISGTGL